MLLIVEGPDCSGKSTLAQRLFDRIDELTFRVKKGPPKSHPLDEYVASLVSYQPSDATYGAAWHGVCDRFHWGERVYPELWSRPTQMDDAVWRYVEMFLLARGAFVVHTIRGIDDHAHCLDTRGDDHGVTSADLPLLLRRYHDVKEDSLLPHHTTSAHCPDDELDEILVQAGLAESVATEVSEFVTYVGSPRAKVLLVGDVRAAGPAPRPSFPAFGPYPATSGHYLLRALIAAEWDLSDVALVNACDVDDVRDVVTVVAPTSIVALGRNAFRRLEELDIEHFAVPHPQWVRRFHHDKLRDYGEAIRQAAVFGREDDAWLR